MKAIRDGIKKFLEVGFYFSYYFDLSSNAQRRAQMLQPEDGKQNLEPLSCVDYRYMWNANLYK